MERVKGKTFEEEFNKFIKKWCGNSFAHLIDNDENDGERLREFVRNNMINISEEQLKDAIHKVGKKIGINTEGKETEEGYDKKTAGCWQCALLDELGIK